MKLTDLLSIDKWIEFEKEITKKSDLNAGVYDVDGIRITGYKNWQGNKICPTINDNKKGQTFICAPAHQNLSMIASNNRKGIAEECDAGIVKVVVPIFVNNEFLGTVGGCGLLFEDGGTESFYISKTLELEESEVEKLSATLNTISEKDTNAVIDFIEKKIVQIIANYKSSKQ
jgi:ligand-binding sensor protein